MHIFLPYLLTKYNLPSETSPSNQVNATYLSGVRTRSVYFGSEYTSSLVSSPEKKMPSSMSSPSIGSGSDMSKFYTTTASQISYDAHSAPHKVWSGQGSPRSWNSARRVGFFTRGPSKLAWIVAIVFASLALSSIWNACFSSIVSVKNCLSVSGMIPTLDLQIHRPYYLTNPYRGNYNTSFAESLPFLPPEPVDYRYSDTIDTFATYKYRKACNISSLDLHTAFSPLCINREELVQAMSGGGRIGFDAPYMPRGCDMRWFSTEEVCEILARFEKVIILGDSMMRHVIGSINVLIRKDLGYGAVTDWNFSPKER